MTARRRIRVLYLDCAPWFGGAQRSLATVLRHVESAGISARLLAADATPAGLLARTRAAGVPCETLDARHWRKSVRGLLQFVADSRRARRRLDESIRTETPDFIHANGVRAALLVPRTVTRSIPLLVHDRDLRIPEAARHWLGRRAAGVIAISQCVAECWRGKAPSSRVHVVPNGIADPGAVTAAEPRRTTDGCRAVLVADLVPWKRHDLFIDALAATGRPQGTPGVEGILVGRVVTEDGHAYLEHLRSRAERAGVGDCVRFVTDADDALPWIASADVLVSASDREPFGRTVIEALQLGKPVVATRGAGPREILEGCSAGTLVEGTAEAVADGLTRWLTADDRDAVRRAARAKAAEYSVERMMTGIRRVYKQVMVG